MKSENPYIQTPQPEEPHRYGMRERIIRLGSIFKVVDKALQQRAEWMIQETGVQKYLAPKIVYKEPGVLKPNNVERGVSVLCIGAGKGHEMDEIDQLLPGSEVIGIDPHDYMTAPVADRLENLAHASSYLGEHFRADHLEGIEDNSMDGITFNFVLHHIDQQSHERVLAEIKRVLKRDGYVFIAEDLADDAEEAEFVEKIDKKVNMEICDGAPHNYRSAEEWIHFFAENGFEVVESHEIKPQSVRHGFFVLRLKQE
ncbi:MAG: class I SAM-dependent methyltransferase [Patescibacteria group bacterium]